MQRRQRLDRHDRRVHHVLDGSSDQLLEGLGQRLPPFEQRQPPIAPGETIVGAATQKIALADHSDQLLVGGEHGNGADTFLKQ